MKNDFDTSLKHFTLAKNDSSPCTFTPLEIRWRSIFVRFLYPYQYSFCVKVPHSPPLRSMWETSGGKGSVHNPPGRAAPSEPAQSRHLPADGMDAPQRRGIWREEHKDRASHPVSPEVYRPRAKVWTVPLPPRKVLRLHWQGARRLHRISNLSGQVGKQRRYMVFNWSALPTAEPAYGCFASLHLCSSA